MLGNIFGAFGALGRLLPGYIQGERQAIQDNWQDLQNYNQTQAGQIQNAFDENVLDDRIDMMGFQRDNAANQANNLYMQTMLQQAMFPNMLQGSVNSAEWLPYIMPAQQMSQYGQLMYPWMNNLGMITGMWPGQQQQSANNPMNLPSSQR